MNESGTYFIVNLGIFPFDIMFSVDEPDSVLMKRLRKFGMGDNDILKYFSGCENSNGRTVIFENNTTIVRIMQNKKSNLSIHGTIAHEIFHAVTFILDEIGIKFSIGISDEVYAYTIGYVTEVVYKELGL